MKALPSFEKLSELKNRLLVVLLGIIIFRMGTYIPVPGLDPQELARLFDRHEGTVLGLFNMFSGGALSRFSVFTLGVMPYISASIIVQLMGTVVPQLEQLKKEGESGRRKLTQYTRFATLFIAAFQALGMAKWLVGNNVVYSPDFLFYAVAILTMVTGTLFIMWLGEQITEKGIGNGISLIIFAGIVSGLPSALGQIFQQLKDGQIHGIMFLFILLIVLGVTAFVVFIERGQRRISINYPQRTQGRKVFAAQRSHLPLKLNISGVIPPIFASSIILLPRTLAEFFSSSGQNSTGWLQSFGMMFESGSLVYMITYASAIVFFAFFYTALVYNPKDTADNLKKSGAFIPGVRPGQRTAGYIDKVMTNLTLMGSLYLVLVCLLPEIMFYYWHVPFYFGGTSLLIIVVVLMDFIAQVQAQLMSQQYKSLI